MGMKALLGLLALTIVVAAWVVWLRPWLRKRSWAAGFFAAIEPIEIALWRKSETLLKARAKMALGLVLTILTQTQTVDITPLMPLVPDEWEPLIKVIWNMIPMVLTVGGWIDEQLRKDTTKPLEVVALPSDVPAPVAAAVAKVEAANAQAVAVAQRVAS